jgi:hypothetical protein
MPEVQSNADAYLLAIPLLALLFVVLFRLDELICRRRVQAVHGRKLCGWDENGVPVCADPIGDRGAGDGGGTPFDGCP